MEQYLPHLSERSIRWVRFVGLVAAVVFILWLAYRLNDVVAPILAALAIAYILNPVVTALEGIGVRRVTSILTFYIAGTLLIGTLSVLLFRQVLELQTNLPEYFGRMQEWFASSQPSIFGFTLASRPAMLDQMNAERVQELVREHGMALGTRVVNTTLAFLSNAMYWFSILVLIPVYAFFFLLHFNQIVAAVRNHLPYAYRDTVIRVVSTIDQAMANFFRGRFIVCTCMGILFAIGWYIVGVRYSIPLGLLAGLLSLIPFMSMLALPPALIFAYLDASVAGQSWVMPVVWVFVVYLAVQAVESFLLSPFIESKASGLHPVAVVVALLVGAQLAGLVGMLLALPLASTLKTLAAEWLLPEMRRLANPPYVPAGPPDAPAVTIKVEEGAAGAGPADAPRTEPPA